MTGSVPLSSSFLLLAATLLLPVCMATSPAAHAQSRTVAEFYVHAGKHERVNVPIRASLAGVALPSHPGTLQLYETTGGHEVPVASQLEPGDPGHLAWILAGETRPGTVRTFALRAVAEPLAAAGRQVRVEDDGERLRLSVGDRPVLAYHYAHQPSPEGVDPIYGRSGFIHPLWSPEGEVLTRIQPRDHYHHYGIWNPWTRTRFEGRGIDFWNLGDRQGTVRAAGVAARTAGPVFGGIEALLRHVDLTAPEGEKVALDEQWEIRAWNADPEGKMWLIDFTSTLNPATTAPLTIEAYRYQGFSLRATERWNDANATLRTSEGYDKRNANGTRARWVDVRGASDAAAGTSGILFMTHPANHNFPEQLRIWPTGMNEGVENVFVNFNPAQEQDWELTPGNAYTLKYRMLVYDGALDTLQAERYWTDYAHPPTVEVFPAGLLAGARVLVYTRNGEGYVHDNIPHSVDTIRRLGQAHGFEVDVSDDPAAFTEENLARYDALIFANTNNEAFTTDAQRQALQAYVRGGGGFVGIHSASGSERDWPWFSRLVGGNFDRHAPQQDFTVEVVDHAHPSTSFLPDTWQIEDDECYYLRELSPGIRVLLAADLTTVEDPEREAFPGDLFGDHFPVAWYQAFDGGRQWYTSLGHRPEQYRDPVFVRHLLGGIQWVVAGTAP